MTITTLANLSLENKDTLISHLKSDEQIIQNIIDDYSTIESTLNVNQIITQFIWITNARLNAYSNTGKNEYTNIYLNQFNKDVYKNLFNFILSNKVKLEITTFTLLIEILLNFKIELSDNQELNIYLKNVLQLEVLDPTLLLKPIHKFVIENLASTINKLANLTEYREYLTSLFSEFIWTESVTIIITPTKDSLSSANAEIKRREAQLNLSRMIFEKIPNLKSIFEFINET